MKYKFIDSHVHLSSNELYFDAEGIVKRAKEAGAVALVNICTDQVTLERGLYLEERYPDIFNTGATTPHDAEKLGEVDFPHFEKAAKEGKFVAIGETGLDYYYAELDRKVQQDLFIRYLSLAKACHLPVIIHCRDAFEDLFAILDKEYGMPSVLLHCFTGSKEEAKQAIERGYMISMSGIVTFKRSLSLQEVASYIPLEHLVIETDAPYLAPETKRGQRNESAFIVETLAKVAHLKNLDIALVSDALEQNTRKFFKI